MAARRHLLDNYKRLRDEGLPDAEAQARLTQQRAEHQKQTQAKSYEQQLITWAATPYYVNRARGQLYGSASQDEGLVQQRALELAKAYGPPPGWPQPKPSLPEPERLLLPRVTGGRVPVPSATPRTDYRRIFAPPPQQATRPEPADQPAPITAVLPGFRSVVLGDNQTAAWESAVQQVRTALLMGRLRR